MSSASTTSSTWSLAARTSEALEVYLLGVVDFDSALFLQQRLVFEISGREDKLGGLLICEHPPMVTIGREGSRDHLLCEPGELIARQIDVRWLNRGGSTLVHAPGQLAVYPIVPLDRLQLGLADYRRRLEQSVIDMSAEQRVAAQRRDDEPGVWCRCGQFTFLGAATKSWVAYHGMFVNVCPHLDSIRLVQSTRNGSPVTSLAAQRQRAIRMHAVRESLARHVTAQLGYRHAHYYTGHPLLRRTKKQIHAYA